MIYLQYLGMLFVVVGIFFVVTATVGMIRFPNFFTKAHAAGMVDSLGSALILVGVLMQNELSMNMIKIMLIILLIWVTSTTGGHVLARTCYNDQNNKHD
ncbi:monovalent cation/H(+) antiporter subunit G [Candidatus Mesenet endosymbiont of Agriotes lineatus]|uniref:monovalent cation/H(+) antiporter subunit G n=1 Tax=Candidatus Mesenet endosymbiont of Agriotes lineatus TaxID=3077948 RepID=UPI0030D31ABF